MLFKLEPTQTPADGVRRILLEQADHALQGLEAQGPSEKAVHEARKACKRARAVVALIRPGLGRSAARRLDVAFRDAARPIGPVRDADVKRATIRDLGGDTAIARVEDRDSRGDQALQALRAARALVEATDLSHVTLSVMADGLMASWRDARRAGEDADTDPHGETLHEWRKAAKRLLYHVQLLEELDPVVMTALSTQLDLLQEALGNHHDLCVLAEEVGASDPVHDELQARADELQERTLALGAWVLAARPRTLRRWLRDAARGLNEPAS